MDPSIIIQIINTMGPLVIPILSAGFTWLMSKIFGAASPALAKIVNPFQPAVAAVAGACIGHAMGVPPLTGAVYGLAGVGLHQMLRQPLKAASRVQS